MVTVGAIDREKKTKQVHLSTVPDKCPICHHGIDAREMGLCYLNNNNHSLQVVLHCPIRSCQRLFIARYQLGNEGGGVTFHLNYVTPTEPLDEKFSETVNAVSEDFVLIFNQAHRVEGLGYQLVAGPGYRKALEFLIKDYLIVLNPENAEKIEQMQLSNCIANFVKSPQIQTTAARAVWLGNDETHYVRKWADKDLSDLKRLIALTVRWIEMEEMTKEVEKSMPTPEKKSEPA